MTTASVLPLRHIDPDADFWQARPELARLALAARAGRASPWGVLGVTLARVNAATPASVVLPPLIGDVASLNLFIAIGGRSGKGKGAAFGVSRRAVRIPSDAPRLDVGSGEAIAHQYRRREKVPGEPSRVVPHGCGRLLFYVPEIRSAGAQAARTGNTLISQLTQAWSGEPLGFAYVDPEKSLPVEEHTYRLCLVTGVQPDSANALLKESSVGFPQRFVWVPAYDFAPPRPGDRPPAPAPVTWHPPPEISTWGNDGTPGYFVLPVCAEAVRDIDEQAYRDRLPDSDVDPLATHRLQNQEKVGAALALFCGVPEITPEFWHLAGRVMARSDRLREEIVSRQQELAAGEATTRGTLSAITSRAAQAEADRLAREDLLRWALDWLTRRGVGASAGLSEFSRACDSRKRGPENANLRAALALGVSSGLLRETHGSRGGSRWELA